MASTVEDASQGPADDKIEVFPALRVLDAASAGPASDSDRHVPSPTSPASSSAPPKESSLPFSKARCIALVATVTGASFMSTFSVQAVIIILPTIGADLAIPSSRLQWVVSAYALAFGCFLLLWGRVADVYGKRRVFVLGCAWVAVVAAANPFVPSEIAFDFFRAFQGLGAAANVPTALGILGTTFPPGKAKTYAFSSYAAGAPLGSVFGNILAGFISQYASWRWVFGLIALLAASTALAGIFVLPPSPAATSHALNPGRAGLGAVDWAGGVLVTTGLLALMFALTEGNVVGWATWYIWFLVGAAFILLSVFVWWQRRLEARMGRSPRALRPLMKMSMFSQGRFNAAMAIMALFFAEFNNFLIFVTYLYQSYLRLDLLETTLRFVPTGVAGVATAAVVSQLLSRVPTYHILLFGNVALLLSNILIAAPVDPRTTWWAYGFPSMALSVIGADTTWPSLTLFTSKALPPEDQALGGALVNAVGQFGRAIGLAVTTAVQTAVMARRRGVPVEQAGDIDNDEASLEGLRVAFWFTAALGVASLLVVLLAFRSSEVVGRAESGPPISGGEEGIMNEEETAIERKV